MSGTRHTQVFFSALLIASGAHAESPRIFQDCPLCPEMAEISPGQFLMGSPPDELDRDEDEGPQHSVTISYRLAAGIHEVTFDQWEACRLDGACRVDPDDVGWGRGRNPVIHVSWHDARDYVGWLSQKTGRPYRLLTEAEWEYVARAGTQTPFHSGPSLTGEAANFDASRPYPPSLNPDYGYNPFPKHRARPVGRYAPNAYGLFDIHGNVSEWVQDCYDPSAYESFALYPAANVQDAATCARIIRGGTSHYSASFARSANRHALPADTRNLDTGFRVGLTLAP